MDLMDGKTDVNFKRYHFPLERGHFFFSLKIDRKVFIAFFVYGG